MIAGLSKCGFDGLDVNAILFAESHSRFIVSVKPENKDAFESMMDKDAMLLGRVTDKKQFVIKHLGERLIDLDTDTLLDAWNKGLEV